MKIKLLDVNKFREVYSRTWESEEERKRFFLTMDLSQVISAIAKSGITTVEALRNLGEDVIETPDGTIAYIVDAMPCEPLSQSEYIEDFMDVVNRWMEILGDNEAIQDRQDIDDA